MVNKVLLPLLIKWIYPKQIIDFDTQGCNILVSAHFVFPSYFSWLVWTRRTSTSSIHTSNGKYPFHRLMNTTFYTTPHDQIRFSRKIVNITIATYKLLFTTPYAIHKFLQWVTMGIFSIFHKNNYCQIIEQKHNHTNVLITKLCVCVLDSQIIQTLYGLSLFISSAYKRNLTIIDMQCSFQILC